MSANILVSTVDEMTLVNGEKSKNLREIVKFLVLMR
jgi:hypothetical protein